LQNLLKSRLKQGQVTLGVTISIPSPEVSFALANLGLDWINFDTQHAFGDTQTIMSMIQAMSYSETVPIVRVVSNELGHINKALDVGAQAVIVPLVNSREDAEKAVRAARYPPRGIRSWGQRAALRDPEYANTANDQLMVIPQVETELAINNLEEIVTTNGVDATFCGPYDLSMSLGVFRQFDSPIFVRAIDRLVSTCEAHDLPCGLLAPIWSTEQAIKQGFKLIALGSDLGMLTESIRKPLKAARAILKPG
jgi:2-keto-3-deoxy-L-rhamnonate aldolase RhmA